MSDQPALDIRQIASHRLAQAHRDAEDGLWVASQTSALLSIAASLQTQAVALRANPVPDDRVMSLLEFAFGIIANVDDRRVPPRTPVEWRAAKAEFIADYHALLADLYGNPARDQVALMQVALMVQQLRAQLAAEHGERSAD